MADITGTNSDETLYGTTGDDTIKGLGGDDIIVGDSGSDDDSHLGTVYVMGDDFSFDSGDFHTFCFPPTLDFSGSTSTIQYNDDDGQLNGDDICNEYSDDTTQSVTIDGVTTNANVDYSLSYCDSNGTIYKFAIVDLDSDGNGHHYYNNGENGKVLIQIGGPAVPAGATLSLVPNSYQNVSSLNYADITDPSSPSDGVGDDVIDGGSGDDIIYGDRAPADFDGASVVKAFVMGADFSFGSGEFHTFNFPPSLSFSGSQTEVKFQDDDGQLNGDDWCNEYSDDKNQSVEINGVTCQVNVDYSLKYCDSDGNVYKFAIVDVDLDGNGHHYYNLPENGKILLQLEGPEVGPDTVLTLVANSFENVSSINYQDIAEPSGGVDHAEGGDDTIKGGNGNDTIFGQGGLDTIEGGNGQDTIHGGDGDDLIYGNIANPGANDALTARAFVMGENFSISSGEFHTFCFPPSIDFSAAAVCVEFNDDDSKLNGDDLCNEYSDDNTQTVTLNGVEYQVNVDYSLKYCDSNGNIYKFAIVDVDLDGNGHHYYNLAENGKILLQLEGPEITAGTHLTIVANSYTNISSLDYDTITKSVVDVNNDEDVIDGGKGDDTIYGQFGDDIIRGGEDNDTVFGGDGNDTIYGGDGHDILHGNNGDDIIYGGEGNDMIFGTSGKDTLYGEGGDDILHGGFGSDILLDGGIGVDKYIGSNGDDILIFGQDDFIGRTTTLPNGKVINENMYNADNGFDKLMVNGDANVDFTGVSYQPDSTVTGNVIAQIEAVIGDEGDQTVTINPNAILLQSDVPQAEDIGMPDDWDGFVAWLGEGDDTFNLNGLHWTHDPAGVINAAISPEMINVLGLAADQLDDLQAYVITHDFSDQQITVWTDAETVRLNGDELFV